MARNLRPRKAGGVDFRKRPRGLTRPIRDVIERIVFHGDTREQACEFRRNFCPRVVFSSQKE